MFWKKAGLVCVVASALGVVSYAQTTKPRARSTSLQTNSGYLGVGLQDVTPEIAKTFNLKDTTGVRVTSVTAGGPAVRAGLHENDVITEFDGQKATSSADLTNSILSKSPDTKINLTIYRGSAKHNLTATLGARPLGLPLTVPGDPLVTPDQVRGMISAAGSVPALNVGFYCVEMMPQLAAFFGVQEGLLVESVDSGSPAAKAGLKAGDVITKVNGMPVTTAREVSGIIRLSGKKIVGFTVFRNKKEMTLNLEMAWLRPDASQRDSVN